MGNEIAFAQMSDLVIRAVEAKVPGAGCFVLLTEKDAPTTAMYRANIPPDMVLKLLEAIRPSLKDDADKQKLVIIPRGALT